MPVAGLWRGRRPRVGGVHTPRTKRASGRSCKCDEFLALGSPDDPASAILCVVVWPFAGLPSGVE